MSRNALSATLFFHIPRDRVVDLVTQVELCTRGMMGSIGDDFGYEAFKSLYGGSAAPLFVVTKVGNWGFSP